MSTLSFTKEAADNLAKAYSTPDVVAQRTATLDLLDLQPGERVIDVGSGPGFLSEEMAARVGPSGAVHGVDISADFIALSQSRTPPPHLTYAQEDALALSAKDGSYDTVVSTQVAEYIPDTAGLLAELFRVLRPGGRVLIMATDWPCIGWFSEDPARAHQMMAAWAGHCPHGSLPRTLAADLTNAGFGNVQIHAHPIINQRFNRQSYSFAVAKLMVDYAKKEGADAATVDAWFDEFTRLDAAGRYYFATTRMIFVAQKPD